MNIRPDAVGGASVAEAAAALEALRREGADFASRLAAAEAAAEAAVAAARS